MFEFPRFDARFRRTNVRNFGESKFGYAFKFEVRLNTSRSARRWPNLKLKEPTKESVPFVTKIKQQFCSDIYFVGGLVVFFHYWIGIARVFQATFGILEPLSIHLFSSQYVTEEAAFLQQILLQLHECQKCHPQHLHYSTCGGYLCIGTDNV